MDFRLREIAGGPAGTYFIVNDNSVTTEIVQTSNLRLVPINSEKGVVNTIVIFQKGDTKGFQAIFGKGLRKNEKQGNYSIKSCLEMLTAGPIAVINLRAFDDEVDTIQISAMSTNKTLVEVAEVPYSSVFNTNSLWTVKPKNIPGLLTRENLLNFANIGNGNVSYFVTVSTAVDNLTDQGNETLASTELEINDYPALRAETLLKETFVDVYIFNNNFDPTTVSTNQYYGHLFNQAGMVNFGNLTELSEIKESGFNRKITGSVIPFLKNENDEDISIDTLINNVYGETGLVCYINDDVLEHETINNLPIINTDGEQYYNVDGTLISTGNLLSHRMQLVVPDVVTLPASYSDITSFANKQLLTVDGDIFPEGEENGNKVYGIFENGIRAGHKLMFENLDTQAIEEVTVKHIEIIEENVSVNAPEVGSITLNLSLDGNLKPVLNFTASANATVYEIYRKLVSDTNFTKLPLLNIGPLTDITDDSVISNQEYVYLVVASDPNCTSKASLARKILIANGETSSADASTINITPKTAKYTKVLMTCSNAINSDSYTRRLRPVEYLAGKVIPTNISGYIPRQEQFTNGSAARQKQILDVLNSPGIIKGLKNFSGIRYVVDVFKSFIEGSYKYQFGVLADELDKCNKFVRCIINEPFIEDLEKSTNPLFKQSPSSVFDLSYLVTGGNPEFSTQFLNKFTLGNFMCFFYGGGKVEAQNNLMVQAPGVSNLFITKAFPWDIIANSSGYLDNISGIEINPDDKERLAMEKFSWNPIIKKGSSFTVYGNYSGIRTRSSLRQIHNSELLAYIKESLFNLSRDEEFKKGIYSEYLRLETIVTNFMEDLALQNAIQPNPIVILNASNNTPEISNAGIKLCRIEYTNINSNDKVVFELDIN